MFIVSFLKRNTDGSYCWPEIEDTSVVDRCNVVVIERPEENIVSASGATVRVKLRFTANDIDTARKLLSVRVQNVR